MNPLFFPLNLELLHPHKEASMEADRSLWCFFVERRDSSGSVPPATTNQEEGDQICLFHILKSCRFQGKLEMKPFIHV